MAVSNRDPNSPRSPRNVRSTMLTHECGRLRALGYTLEEIAEKVGLKSRRGAWHHVKKWEKAAKEEIVKTSKEHRERQLSLIDALIRETWEEWERSKLVKIRKTTKARGPAAAPGSVPVPQNIEQSTVNEERTGNATYLKLLIDLLKQRAELLGINAATKIETTGPSGGPLQHLMRADEKTLESNIKGLLDRSTSVDAVLTGQLSAMRIHIGEPTDSDQTPE